MEKVAVHKRRGRTKDRMRILERDGFTCQVCGESYPETFLECDHEIPIEAGGSDEDSNKSTKCIPCHRKKTDNERARRKIY